MLANFVRGSIEVTFMQLLTLMVGRLDCAITFFRWLFLHEKRGFEVSNSISESKKKNCFNTVFWGDIEGMGTTNPPLKLHPGAPHY